MMSATSCLLRPWSVSVWTSSAVMPGASVATLVANATIGCVGRVEGLAARVVGHRAHGGFVAGGVPEELRVRGQAVGAAERPRGGDRGQLEQAPVHAAADGQVEVGPGVGDLGPAAEDRRVVGQVAPGLALPGVPAGQVTGGVGFGGGCRGTWAAPLGWRSGQCSRTSGRLRTAGVGSAGRGRW